jgi:hypothetical protein
MLLPALLILLFACTLFFPEVVITLRNQSTDTIITLVIDNAGSSWDAPPSASDNLLNEPLPPGAEFTMVHERYPVDIEIGFEHLNPIVIRDIDLNEMEKYILTIE